MRVFISWAGETSNRLAALFNEWLPNVIQRLEPWYSRDIEKGTRWLNELHEGLRASQAGIFCVTRESLSSVWMAFEAGAVSKIPTARVCTVLLDTHTTDVPYPLAEFQQTQLNKDDVYALLQSLNSQLAQLEGEHSLTAKQWENAFEAWWPRFEEGVRNIRSASPVTSAPARTDRELLEEIVAAMRALPSVTRWRGSYLHLLYLPKEHFHRIAEITDALLNVPGVVAVGPLLPEPSGNLSIPIRTEGVSEWGTEFRAVLNHFGLHWGSINSLGPHSLGLP